MSNVAIQVDHLSKQYRIGSLQQGGSKYKSLREELTKAVRAPVRRAGRLLRGEPYGTAELDETIWALQDVSFEVDHGEVLGIIGANGAGKTTLLKILSRITEPAGGRAVLHGRVGSLLEVGTGFHPELTGREKTHLNGAILGMTKKEIERKFDEIVEFSGVEKFIDTPVKHYSSGMRVRLAFSVAAHLDPEILLIDEVLAVGDAQFQKKCLGKMGEVAKGGRTVLFVSHNMGAVRQLSPTSLGLSDGQLRERGRSAGVIESYLESAGDSVESAEALFAAEPAKAFRLRAVRLLDQRGELTEDFSCDAPVIIQLVCESREPLPGLYGYLSISRRDGTTVMVANSFDAAPNPLDSLPKGLHEVRITVPPRTLGPGEYTVYLNFTSRFSKQGFNVDSPGNVCAFRLADFTTRRGNQRGGFFSTRLSWNTQQMAETAEPAVEEVVGSTEVRD